MQSNHNLLKTPLATEALGRSKKSLMRMVDVGCLEAGVHFFRGPFPNSPITWDVDACKEKFAALAKLPAPPCNVNKGAE